MIEIAKPFACEFFVHGIPKTAGSKRAFMPKGWKRPIIVDDCAKSKDWKSDVKAEAVKVCPMHPLLAPMLIELIFVMPRPKSHYRSNGTLKPNAPYWVTTKPDTLKMARAIEDAITGIIWRDDSQIVDEKLIKRYGEIPGCNIRIESLANELSPNAQRRSEAGEGMLPLRGMDKANA